MNIMIKHTAPLNATKAGVLSPNFQSLWIGTDVTLSVGRVHEVLGNSADYFALSVAFRTSGAVIWIGLETDIKTLSPFAMVPFVDSQRIYLVSALSRLELLWAAEQVLLGAKQGCVILEMAQGPDLRESRRLQIAAEASGAIGLILITHACTSAAETRWQCEAGPAGGWQWSCLKNKRGATGSWFMGNEDNAHIFDLVPSASA